MKAKERLYNILLTDEIDDPLETPFHTFLIGLIFLSVVSVILETEESLYALYGPYFRGFEAFCITIFVIEYILRLWVCTMDSRYRHPIVGRIRFALTPMALVDLIAILPGFVPTMGMDLRFVRAVRLTRLFRLFKLSHYSQSLKTLGRVLNAKKEELLVTLFAGGIILVIASSLMYYVERDVQPDSFGSIPRAMWWGVVTLTTVGYGDVYPKTVLGKMLSSVIAVLGIGLFALPAGIIASGFATEIQNKKTEIIICPHCGKDINSPQVISGTLDTDAEQISDKDKGKSLA